jgi:hypothetical protein
MFQGLMVAATRTKLEDRRDTEDLMSLRQPFARVSNESPRSLRGMKTQLFTRFLQRRR